MKLKRSWRSLRKSKCEDCQIGHNLSVVFINGNPCDCRPSNLKTQCGNCLSK